MCSIRGRLTLLLIISLGLLLVGSGALLYTIIRAQLIGEFDRALLAKAQALIMLTEDDGQKVEIDVADKFMPEFAATDTPEYFALWQASGQLIAKSPSLGEHQLPRHPVLTNEPVFQNLVLPNGLPGRLVEIVFVPQVDPDADAEKTEQAADPPTDQELEIDDVTLDPTRFPDRAAVLLVARDREALDTLLRILWWSIGIVIAGLLAIMVGLVRSALRVGLRPLDEVRQQVDQLDAYSLTTGIQVHTQTTELVPVVAQLNALLHRLDAAFARERQFSSDVAHELRTPLAELRTLTEVGGRWPEDTKAVTQYFADAHAISLHMERIVTGLLTLARCEGGTLQVSLQHINVRELVEASWASVACPAQEKTLTFHYTMPPMCCVTADRDLLLIVLNNLLSNAVTYSPPLSEIYCVATVDGDTVHLTIRNPAEDLAPEDIPHLFERFWRKDPARTTGDHTGLGLAVVKALSETLHLDVHAALEAEHIFAITLSLPCVRSS
jgi:two-component system sensor histidine kinase QseC